MRYIYRERSLKKLDFLKDAKEASLYVRPHEVALELEESQGAIATRITNSRLLGARVRVELESMGDGKVIEADIGKEQWSEIRAKKAELVYARFLGAKIYSQDEMWSDYII
ncbi:MAG: TOBE-like domain-containing protein [Wolinella sp.]